MKKLIVLLSLMTVFTAPKAEAKSFYQWTEKNGTIAATDEGKHVPAQYRGTVIMRSFAELEKTSRISYANVSTARLVPLIEADQVRISVTNPEVENPSCTGKVSVNTERRQVGEYNRTFYTVTNECGVVVYDSPVSPRLQMIR